MYKPNFTKKDLPFHHQKTLHHSPITWPNEELNFEHGNSHFLIRPLKENDIKYVLEIYRNHCSYFYLSTCQRYLEEEFYHQSCAKIDNWKNDKINKDFFCAVIIDKSKEKIIGASLSKKEPHDLVIRHSAVAMNPEYRGHSLATPFMNYLDKVFSKSGTDYVFGLVTAMHQAPQMIMKKAGFKMGGIVPGIMRRTFDGENYYRDNSILMYKFYNDAEDYCIPTKEMDIAPEIMEDFMKNL